MTTGPDLLNEYGSALRGSWGDIDGRSERAALDALAEAMRAFGVTELPKAIVRALRLTLDVCQNGSGHWSKFCGSDCEATK